MVRMYDSVLVKVKLGPITLSRNLLHHWLVASFPLHAIGSWTSIQLGTGSSEMGCDMLPWAEMMEALCKPP